MLHAASKTVFKVPRCDRNQGKPNHVRVISSFVDVVCWLLCSKMATVRSLLQLTQSKLVKNVFLSASEDLKCVNMFCEKVGGPCVCRIERVLARNDLTETVEALDLSVNQLTQLPPSLYKLSKMKTLNLRDNDLASLIADDFLHLTELETIDLSNNPIENSVSVIESLQVALPKVKIIFHT